MTPEQQSAIARAEALARAQARLEATQATGQGGSTTQPAAAAPAPLQASERAGVLQRGLGAAVPGSGSVVSGLGDSAIKAALGIKSLFTDLSPENKGVLEQIRQESERESGMGAFGRGAGEVAGNIAMTAVPGAKAGSVLAKAAGAGRAARTLATVGSAAGVSGATGFALTPSEAEGAEARFAEKGRQAAIDAALGAGMQGVGTVLRKATTRMFTPSPDAVKLMEAGITPTLSQGAERRIGKSIGSLAAGSRRVLQRQNEELGESLFRKITEGNRDIPGGTGNELLESAQDYVSRAYDDVFQGQKFPITQSLVGRASAAASQTGRLGGGAKAAGEAAAIIADTIDATKLSARGTRMTQKEIQKEILTELKRKAARTNDPGVVAAIDRARDVFKNHVYGRITPEQLMRVKDIDRLNYDLSRMKTAAKDAAGENVGVGIDRLKTAYGRADPMAGVNTVDELVGPAQRVLGPTHAAAGRGDVNTTMRILAPLGVGGIGVATSNPIIAPILAGLYGTSAIGQTVRGARFLMGQNQSQKDLAEALRRAGPYLYGAGAAASPGEE